MSPARCKMHQFSYIRSDSTYRTAHSVPKLESRWPPRGEHTYILEAPTSVSMNSITMFKLTFKHDPIAATRN